MPQGSSEKLLMAYITLTCSNLEIPSPVLNTSFCFLAFHPAQQIFNKTRTAISRKVLKFSFSIDVPLRQICSSCCDICPSFVGRRRTALRLRLRLRNAVDEQENKTDGHTFCNLHTVYLGIFLLKTHYKSSVSHQRLLTDNKLCRHTSLNRNAVPNRSKDTKLCHGGIHSDRHAHPAYCLSFVHSCQQKSIGPKFSKSQTGSDVRYSCRHNSSRFTFPIFAHSCRFSVLHSLQSITPGIY